MTTFDPQRAPAAAPVAAALPATGDAPGARVVDAAGREAAGGAAGLLGDDALAGSDALPLGAALEALRDPAGRRIVEAAFERWRRTSVRKAVLRAPAEDRLLYRLEAEALAEAARGVLLGGWAPARAVPSPRSPRPARAPTTEEGSAATPVGGDASGDASGGAGAGATAGAAAPAGSAARASALADDDDDPPRLPGDALRRIGLAIELGSSLERALVVEAHERGQDARSASELAMLARVGLDAHLHRLHKDALAERAIHAEALLSLRGLFANLRDGLLFVDRQGVVVDVNRSICRATRLPREAIVGRRWDEVWPQARSAELRGLYARVLASGEPETVYGLTFLPPGAEEPEVYDLVVAPRQLAGRAAGTVSIVHYRTDQARLEDRLRAADKMASIGRVAAGIAHEFRNLLAGVRALAELGHGGAEEASAAFRKIVRVADQASAVALGLLSFARRAPRRLADLDAAELLRDALDLGLTARERARLDAEVAVDPAAVVRLEGDRGALTQALVNLVLNAAQAMQREGGRLRLGARTLTDGATGEATSEAAREATSEAAGASQADEDAAREPGWVELTVEDDGPGIAPEQRERIFEPFVSGREPEFGERAGTGLGLPMVKAVVERHGGEVRVEAGEGGGSRFVLRLPRRQPEGAVGERAAVVEPAPAGDGTPGASPSAAPLAAPAAPPSGAAPAARVLVVDDAKVIRQIVRTVLEKAGFAVATARSVGAARQKLRLAEDEGRPFAVVLLDLVVPGLSGPRTIRALRRRYPDLRVAILTGQSLTEGALRQVLRLSDAFVEKPFQVAALVERVRLLAATAPRAAPPHR